MEKRRLPLEDKRRANSASTDLNVLVFMVQAARRYSPVPAVRLPFSHALKSVGEKVFIFTADCTFFPTVDFPTGNQSLKGRASRIICDVTNIRQTDRCLKFTQVVRKCVCIK